MKSKKKVIHCISDEDDWAYIVIRFFVSSFLLENKWQLLSITTKNGVNREPLLSPEARLKKRLFNLLTRRIYIGFLK